MESHNSREELVDAEAGLASLKTPKNLSFVRIPRKKGSRTTLINYFFIAFGIVLIALVSYEIWQLVRSEKLIKQIQIQNEERQDEEFLRRIQVIEEQFDRQNVISATTGLPQTTSIRLEADDTIQYTESRSSFMEIPLDSPSLKIIEEDVIQGSDDSGSSVPAMITESVDAPESGRLWVIHFNFGRNSGDNDTIESKDAETMPLVKKDASEEGWSDYIHRMFFNPFATKFGMSWRWTWGNSSREDNQSLESAEDLEEKIDSIETETVTTSMIASIDAPRNYDYRYEDYPVEDKEYQTLTREESYKNSDEDLEILSNTTVAWVRQGSDPEDVEEVVSSTSTEAPPIFEVPSIYENTDHVSQYDNFGETTEQSAEDESKSAESTTEDLSKQDHLLIEEYFRNLSEERIAEVALFEKLYSMIQNAEKYPDYVIERDYGDDSSHSSMLELLTETLENSNLTSSLASTVGEDSDEDDFLTSTEVPHISESTVEAIHDFFWRAWFKQTFTTEKDAEDRFESPGEIPEVLSKRDDPLSEHEDFSDTKTLSWPHPTEEEPDEYSDYIYDDYEYASPSYIAKRSVDTPSALEIPSEPVSAEDFGRKMSILRDAIEKENHLLMNEVALTSGPKKQVLQAKLDNFYANMEVVSAHIDRLHERYLRLNKLNDDYVSKELPAEEVDTPWTPVN